MEEYLIAEKMVLKEKKERERKKKEQNTVVKTSPEPGKATLVVGRTIFCEICSSAAGFVDSIIPNC